jgi:hypothetical protein
MTDCLLCLYFLPTQNLQPPEQRCSEMAAGTSMWPTRSSKWSKSSSGWRNTTERKLKNGRAGIRAMVHMENFEEMRACRLALDSLTPLPFPQELATAST